MIETEKWSDQFVKDVVKAFLNCSWSSSGIGDKTDLEKGELLRQRGRWKMEFEFPGWIGCNADAGGEQFRQLL